MSTSMLPGSTKQLKFSMGGGGKMEYLFGAGLAIVILGSVVIMVWNLWGGPSGGGDSPKEIHMLCLNPSCGKETVYKLEDMTPENGGPMMGMTPYPGMDPNMMPKCKHCQQPSLLMMRHCPNCKKFFATDAMKQQFMNYESMGAPLQEEKCTHCGTDVLQYWRDKARR